MNILEKRVQKIYKQLGKTKWWKVKNIWRLFWKAVCLEYEIDNQKRIKDNL